MPAGTRQRESADLRLSFLELRPRRAAAKRGVPPRRPRQGRHAGGFRLAQHRLEPVRVEMFSGLVFGTFSDATVPVEAYLGETMARMIRRNLGRPLRLLGMHSQIIHNNWKLYAENVRDYHATLLHTFYTTFKVNRLDMDGGMLLSDDGRHSISYARRDTLQQSDEYQKVHSAQYNSALAAPENARYLDRVRRRYHPLHPDDIPDTRGAADAEFAGGAVLHAARHRQDRAVLDLPRLQDDMKSRRASG